MSATGCEEFLGPFLCRPSHQSMAVWISVGRGLEERIFLELFEEDLKVVSIPFKLVENSHPYFVYIADTAEAGHRLKSDTYHRYQIKLGEDQLDFKGIQETDLYFRTLSEPKSKSSLSFVLMSCHGIEQFQKDHQRWTSGKCGKGSIKRWTLR
jgi:hypothetical protein